jgi:hypothetical protein
MHEEGGSQIRGAPDKSGELLPLMDLDSQGAIPLGARNMDEQDSNRARSTAPSRMFRISCKTHKGKVSIPPHIAHASGYVSCCKIAAEISALTSP